MSGPCENCGGAWGADTPICPACGGKEIIACQKCGGYGGKIVTFKYPTRRTESRWICPWCLDLNGDEILELRRKIGVYAAAMVAINELMEDL